MSTIPQSCRKSRIFTYFPHSRIFFQNVPHFWLYFEKQIFLQIVIFLAPDRHFVRNGSFTVKDFRLYDENSSSKGRSPAAHIAQTSQLPSSLPKQIIARWLLLAANVRTVRARPARRRIRNGRCLFDNNPTIQ